MPVGAKRKTNPRKPRARSNLLIFDNLEGCSVAGLPWREMVTFAASNPLVRKTRFSYGDRLISVITIENRKIVLRRDYMDSLAAWNALNGSP